MQHRSEAISDSDTLGLYLFPLKLTNSPSSFNIELMHDKKNTLSKMHEVAMRTNRYFQCPLILQTGAQYIKIPKQNEKHIVIIAYAYALQGCMLSLIALNSVAKVETVLRQPNRPNCIPTTTVSQSLVFTWIKQHVYITTATIMMAHSQKLY